MENFTLIFNQNGPIEVPADAILKDHDGRVLTHPVGGTLFLCRCGASANKPFCDGAHKKIGFDGSLAAS